MECVFPEFEDPPTKSEAQSITYVKVFFKNGSTAEMCLDCSQWDFWTLWNKKFKPFQYYNIQTGTSYFIRQKDVSMITFNNISSN